MVLQGLLKIRVANGKKRVLPQIESKKTQPQSAERERQNDVQPGWQGARGEFRPRHPEKIHEAHENQPQRDFRENLRIAFHVLRKKQEKGNEEMKNQHEHGNGAPAAIQPRAIEADLFREIAGPNDQQLREIKVSPEHHESEEQLREVVQVALLQNTGKRLGAREQDYDGDHKRHRGDQLSRDKEEAINRGSPVRRQGHHPVNGGEGHRKSVEDDAGAGEHFQAAAQGTVALVDVLLLRQTVKDEHERQPDREVNQRTELEATGGQIVFLKIRQRLLF